MDSTRLPKALLEEKPEQVGGRWRRGRHQTRWEEAVERDARSTGMEENIQTLATHDCNSVIALKT
jgi:hypothetical protein